MVIGSFFLCMDAIVCSVTFLRGLASVVPSGEWDEHRACETEHATARPDERKGFCRDPVIAGTIKGRAPEGSRESVSDDTAIPARVEAVMVV